MICFLQVIPMFVFSFPPLCPPPQPALPGDCPFQCGRQPSQCGCHCHFYKQPEMGGGWPPRRSQADPPPILPLAESKPSLSEPFKNPFKALSLSKSSQGFCFSLNLFYMTHQHLGQQVISSVRVFTPLKTIKCFETWITYYTNSFSHSQRYASYWGLK